jgi:template-activating factor I
MMNHQELSGLILHHHDQVALTYLEDVWVARNPDELRCYSIEFWFKPNPYFSDSMLLKEYRYAPPPGATSNAPDEDGITEAMLDFAWERDVKQTAMKIKWKDDSKNLTKLYPRTMDEEGDDDAPADSGSFFNYFEHDADPFDVRSPSHLIYNRDSP